MIVCVYVCARACVCVCACACVCAFVFELVNILVIYYLGLTETTQKDKIRRLSVILHMNNITTL